MGKRIRDLAQVSQLVTSSIVQSKKLRGWANVLHGQPSRIHLYVSQSLNVSTDIKYYSYKITGIPYTRKVIMCYKLAPIVDPQVVIFGNQLPYHQHSSKYTKCQVDNTQRDRFSRKDFFVYKYCNSKVICTNISFFSVFECSRSVQWLPYFAFVVEQQHSPQDVYSITC